MRKSGAINEFCEQRDRELHKAFIDILSSAVDVPLREMFAMAAASPCSRFWVSEERAADIVSAIRRDARVQERDEMLPKRREMFEEIARRVDIVLKEHPDMPLQHAVRKVICRPAPEFYLTPESARTIIYNFTRKRRRQNASQ